MTRVRDSTIREIRMTLNGEMKHPQAEPFREEILNVLNGKPAAVLEPLIRESVDLAIHNLLWAADGESEFELVVGGARTSEVSDGLPGELYTSDGWIARFSGEPASEDQISD